MTFGTTRWIYALFEAGEVAGVDRAMEELESVVRQIRQPQYTYVQAGFVTMRALLEGRFTEAEQLTLQALTLGQRLQVAERGRHLRHANVHVASRAGSSTRGCADC